MLNDFYGQAPAYAFVGEANQSVETSIEPALTEIRKQLTQADVVHFDETGMRVAGQTQWVHAAVFVNIKSRRMIFGNRGVWMDCEREVILRNRGDARNRGSGAKPSGRCRGLRSRKRKEYESQRPPSKKAVPSEEGPPDRLSKATKGRARTVLSGRRPRTGV
ncbi:MAG: transposase [Caldilineaceae bacterium]|nr:transposase [Caldilineaceae bacterium]